jgi:DNA-binding CsgD family transcriptional regulator
MKRALTRGPSAGFVVLQDGLYKYAIEKEGDGFQLRVSECLIPRRHIERLLAEGNLITLAQAKVATLIAAGCTHSAIARRLHISPHTVRRHTEAVFQRLSVSDRAELAERVTKLVVNTIS